MNLKSLLDTKVKDYFYIMHLSWGTDGNREPLWKYAKEKKLIGLSHFKVQDEWNNVKDSGSVKDLSGIWKKQFETFYNEMKKDDIVVILAGWDSILGVAEVKKEDKPTYSKKSHPNFFEHFRKVNWLKKYDFNNPGKPLYPLKGFNNTLQKIEKRTKTKRWKSLMTLEVS